MKLSIRTKFGIGMVFTFLITLVLLGLSAYYLNQLSNKTSAILKENYMSLVYAREMNDGLTKVSQEMTLAFLEKRTPDKSLINSEFECVNHSLQLEKSNFTEPGEDKLVYGVESLIAAYRDSIVKTVENISSEQISYFLKKQEFLSGQLLLLSKMNGRAIETKTEEARIASKDALTGMTILGSFCFLVALIFIYSFASYFNERFIQLYNGIRQIADSNYGQRLYFDGVDEFYEISVLFNQMAEKLSQEHIPNEERTTDFLRSPEGNDESNREED